jgi:hypothetical protein
MYMKRGIKLVAAALAVVVLLSSTVFAVGGQNPTITDQVTGAAVAFVENGYQKLSVSYTNAAANGLYLVMVVAADENGNANTISADNILYIDQAQADASGKVTFSTVYPSQVTNSVVLLSGTGLSKPMTLAKISVPFTLGDVDGSGTVDVFDVITLARYVSGKTVTQAWSEEAADVNGDGTVNGNDLTLLAQYVAKLSTDFSTP